MTAGSHRAQELVTEMVLSVETDFVFLANTERKKAPCLLCASHLPTASAARGQDDQKDEPGAGDFPQEQSHACPSSHWSPQTSWQRERGRAAAVLRPYQSHLLAGTQSTTPGDTKSRDRLLMAGVRVLPRIPSLLRVSESSQHTDELTTVRPTCCSYPPSLVAVAGAGGKGQAVEVKLLLEPLKMQTNTSDMLRSLLGGGRAIKKLNS